MPSAPHRVRRSPTWWNTRRAQLRRSWRPLAERLEDRLLLATDVFGGTQATITLEIGGTGGTVEIIDLSGTTSMVRDDVPSDGVGGNGLEDIDLEIINLNLTGNSESLGPLSLQLARPGPPSLGFAEESNNSVPQQLEAPIFSLLAMFPLLTAEQAGLQGVTQQPVALQAALSQVPPAQGETYRFNGAVPLVDSATAQPLPVRILALSQTLVTQDRFVEHDVFENTTSIVELVGGPLGPVPQIFILRGSAETEVVFDGPTEGSAIDDRPADGFEEVATELVHLDLSDASGEVRLTESAVRRSLGTMTELSNDTPGVLDVSPFAASGAVAADFEVYFELRVGGQLLHNEQPLRLQSVIHEKPPFRRFVSDLAASGPIELLDTANVPTGIVLLKAEHTTGAVEIDTFEQTIGQLLLEVPDAPGVITTDPGLPSLEAVNRSLPPGSIHFAAPGVDIVLSDLQQVALAAPPPERSTVGLDETQQFVSSLRGTANVAGGPPIAFQWAGATETVARGKAGAASGSWPTELLSMDLQGTIGSQAILLRESPTESSLGRVSVRPAGVAEYEIDSFQEVFWELSLDGGLNWVRADRSWNAHSFQRGVRTTDPQFPSVGGGYRSSPLSPFSLVVGEVQLDLQDLRQRVIQVTDRTLVGNDELQIFDTSLQALATLDGGPFNHLTRVVELTGTAQTRVVGKAGNTSGTFETELLALDLSGEIENSSLQIRLDAGRESAGQVTIRDLGGGQFHIDSFFDLFTELAIDSGPFHPSPSAAHLELANPPQQQLISSTGSATVAVHFEGPNEGDAHDEVPDGFGRDEVETEIVSLDLVGPTPFGAIHISQRAGFFSPGQIEEVNFNDLPGTLQVPPFDTRPAQTGFSTFAVWSQISIADRVFVTHEPFSIASVIENKPPINQERYVSPDRTPIPLFDEETGTFTGFYALREVHQTSSTVEHDLFPLTVGQLLLDVQGTPVLIPAVGSSQVDVYFEGPAEGSAQDDDGNGLDEVVAEIVDLSLSGPTPLGTVTISLDAAVPSLGQIEELSNNTPGRLDVDPFERGNASSYFDVSFVVDLNGRQLAPALPTRLEAIIEDKPPSSGERYLFAPDEPIELFDILTGQGTGIFIVREVHDPAPTIEHDSFDETVGQILLELPAQPGVVTTLPALPPFGSVYQPPAGTRLTFPGPVPIIIQNLDLRPLADPPPTVTTVGADEQQRFQAVLRGVSLVAGESVAVELRGTVDAISRGKAGQTTGSWDTEIFAMDLRGSIPGGPNVILRESPAVASSGRAAITQLDDETYQIDSFFDVFTEVSVNGGQSWIASGGATHLEAFNAGTSSATSSAIPARSVLNAPRDVTYSSPAAQFIFQNLRVQPIDAGQSQIIGDDELFRANVRLTAISQGPGGVPAPFELAGPLAMLVRGKAGNTTGTFDTEIISLELSGSIGGVPALLRESPGLASSGSTAITNFNGRFHIDSFVNLSTELSVNGGATFVPAIEATPLELAALPDRVLISAVGPSAVDVYFEGDSEGDASDDDLDGRDEVVAQLVSLDLTGQTPLGAARITLNPSIPALGQIEELVNTASGRLDVSPFAEGAADSYFDVSFQIDLAGRTLLPLTTTTRLNTTIFSKPPASGERYLFDPPAPVPLIDAATGLPSGFSILREIHEPAPTVEHDLFPASIGQLLLEIEGVPVLLSSVGPAQIDVRFEGSAEGSAVDDDGNGRDEVVAQIVDLGLAGPSPFGPIQVSLDPASPSLGRIEELVNNTPGVLDVDPFAPGGAESYFDLFFVFEINGRRLAPSSPTRLESLIESKPPGGERYRLAPTDRVELVDLATGEGSDIFLVQQVHDLAPQVEHDRFPETTRELVLELPPNPFVIAPVSALPALGGEFRSAEQAIYGPPLIQVANITLRPLFDPPPVVTTAGLDETQQFQALLRADVDLDGAGVLPAVLQGTVTTVSYGKAGQPTGSFETEIVSMDLRGTLPGLPEIRLRQANNGASPGRTTIVNRGDGTFQIDSFFDVATEISLDAGQTWFPSIGTTRIEAFEIGVNALLADVPSPDGQYRAGLAAAQYVGPDGTFLLEDIRHQFLSLTSREAVGPHEVATYDSSVTAVVVGPTGVTTPIELRGPAQAIFFGKAGRTIGSFDTEILSMVLTGTLNGTPIQLQKSPFLPSSGSTTITAIAGRGFHINSFFDLFTELSLDGGQTFAPSSATTEFVLADTPEQMTAILNGSRAVDVYFEGAAEGSAEDDDGNGRDEVVARVVELALSGQTPIGPVSLTLNPALPSLGRIEEESNGLAGILEVEPFATGDANSYFDTAWQLDIGGDRLAPFNLTTRLEGVILDLPPRSSERFEFNPSAPLPLIDVQTGRRSGYAVVREAQFATTPQFLVTSFNSTPSGFIARFNGSLDAESLNLYDSQTAGLGPTDIVLQGQTTGEVSGSLLVDALFNRVTFVKTGGPLLPDTYNVLLRSGANGFQDVNGTLLDGDGDGIAGDDFLETFTVAPPAGNVAVGVPDFVRGPGQEVQLPANSSNGIPVGITNGAGVRQIALRIDFDPSRLLISGASVAAGMPAGATVSLDTSLAGRVIVNFSSPADLSPGAATFANLQASVPAENGSANLNSKQLLNVSSVEVRTAAGLLPSVADDAVHLVSYFGDVSGNGRINASDAARIARVAALLDTGFDVDLAVDRLLLGDISGNGRINASDASRVAQFAALFPVPEIPPIPRVLAASGDENAAIDQLATGGLVPLVAIGPASTAEASIWDQDADADIEGWLPQLPEPLPPEASLPQARQPAGGVSQASLESLEQLLSDEETLDELLAAD